MAGVHLRSHVLHPRTRLPYSQPEQSVMASTRRPHTCKDGGGAAGPSCASSLRVQPCKPLFLEGLEFGGKVYRGNINVIDRSRRLRDKSERYSGYRPEALMVRA